MSGRRGSLSSPERTGMEDPGAHDLDSSEYEDHFSDAQSGPSSSRIASPIPKTRVERVSDEPSYGEVPGTEAYRKREEDAAPDEIAIIPPTGADDSTVEGVGGGSPAVEGGNVPLTVVDESEGPSGSAERNVKKHEADPSPDVLKKANGTVETNGNDQTDSDAPQRPSASRSPSLDSERRNLPLVPQDSVLLTSSPPLDDDEDGDEDARGDDFGDDFDDFEEGGGDDDFGDFDDGFQELMPTPPIPAQAVTPQPQAFSFPIPDFDGLDHGEILQATEPYMNALFPQGESDIPPLPSLSSKGNPVFQTPRSASLWSQLVAPPPLQPPDWIRSRIRRLFLVSLGVPVDLDEILPASKQKKLILPSLHRTASSGSLRTSTDSRSVSRLRAIGAEGGDNLSTTSLDSQGKPSSKKGGSGSRKGPPPAPTFDLVAARQLCATTDEALDGMTDEELQGHVARLQAMEGTAKELLEYWRKRTDEKIGDREAFEGVIENLVKHARKVRK